MGLLGEEIKKLGFGMMRLPMIEGEVDLEQTKEMTDLFLSKGFSYFDTSWGYLGGKSEEAIKAAVVDRHPRDSFQIATKCPVFTVKTREAARGMIWTSLKRMGLEHVDFYLLHNLGGGRTKMFDDYGMWEWALELKEKGIVRHVGFSIHDTAQALDSILTKHPETEFVQFQLNYDDWESPSVQSKKCLEVSLRHNVPIVVMEPLKGGLLANPPESVKRVFTEAGPDASMASWGLRFAASQPNLITVLSGMSTMEQMRQNVSLMEDFQPMTEKEFSAVEKARAALAVLPGVPCTGCMYCVEDCPQNIPIPKVIGAWNRNLTYGDLNTAHGMYVVETFKLGKASDCAACGNCELVCPQHIEIGKNMKIIGEALDPLPSFLKDPDGA